MATRKVRVKKLNTKQPLDVLIEDEIDASEYQSLTQELSIATGVEQAEENVRTLSRGLARDYPVSGCSHRSTYPQ